MSAASRTWTQPSFKVLPNAISSPESECGVMLSDSPDGPMLDLFGREVVLAPVSQPLEKAKGLRTLVTSGLIGSDSSVSRALQTCLESRLMQRLDTAGSTLFNLTWKRRTTPLGRRYLERAASGRRTSGSVYIFVPYLQTIASLASVPTPMSGSPDAGNNDYSRKIVELASVRT